MLASFRNTDNIYKGCLAYLRDELTSVLPEGQHWYTGEDVKYIVGTKEIHNVHNNPWDASAESYFEIYFGNKTIFPTAYSLQGRRIYNYNLLKGWNFFGRNVYGQWVLLSSFSNSLFKQHEIRTFPLKVHESFSGFKIQMTEPESNGLWALCLGQIEVFGDIYTNNFFKTNALRRNTMIYQMCKNINYYIFIVNIIS